MPQICCPCLKCLVCVCAVQQPRIVTAVMFFHGERITVHPLFEWYSDFLIMLA